MLSSAFEVPILPLRGVVAFPGAEPCLVASRYRAFEPGTQVGLLLCSEEQPAQVGTLAEVLQADTTSAQDTPFAVPAVMECRPTARFRVIDLQELDPTPVALVEPLEDVHCDGSSSSELAGVDVRNPSPVRIPPPRRPLYYRDAHYCLNVCR